MGDSLLSVGLDVGTTTTQLIVSRLEIENRASAFAVPDMAIGEKRVLYKSPVRFTPLLSGELVDGAAIRRMVAEEYEKAGIRREDVDTGAVIITGETSRKENAGTVLEALSDFAGEFVVAAAGPDLESVLSAKGAGAAAYSERTGKTVLHMDIGGGTSNLSLIENGAVTATACLNVGGRLVKFDENGTVTYVSPAVAGLTPLKPGDSAPEAAVLALAEKLNRALEEAAGLREEEGLAKQLHTRESGSLPPLRPEVISFSGGVADCVREDKPPLAFGDMGPALGRAIRAGRLCRGEYRLGEETIRATVIGAGCHSARLSGSTVYARNVPFPLKNLPVTAAAGEKALRAALEKEDGGVVFLPDTGPADYGTVARRAEELADAYGGRPLRLAMEADMAKALGQALALRLPEAEILAMDSLSLPDGCYLDVGAPVGCALPVVVKTLILQ